MLRVALVVNPGSRTGSAAAVADELRRRGADVELVDPDRLPAVAALRPDRVVAAGGDGTIGPVAAAAGAAGVPLALVPTGTANDFARALELPTARAAACALAVAGERTRRLDLGRIGRRPFVNVVSAGLSPVAARRARGLKARLGVLAYAVGAARAAVSTPPLDCRLACDGADVFAGRAWQAMVAVTGAFGAGAGIAAADPADGRLDAAVIPAGPRARLASYAYALRSGRVAERAEVRHVRARSVKLVVPPGTELNVDGELVRAGPSSFAVEPAAFDVVVP